MDIYLIIPETNDFKDVSEVLRKAITQAHGTLVRMEEISDDTMAKGINDIYLKRLRDAIDKAEIIIADISSNNPNVMYELGIAKSAEKPFFILSTKDTEVPADLNQTKIIHYDRLRLQETLLAPLYNLLNEISTFGNTSSTFLGSILDKQSKTVFISYSHADREFLNRLRVHLKPFEKENIFDIWSDTDISAGAKWKEQIEIALRKSAIAILLISADFLASDFIVENELPPLLRAADEEGKTILPVIVSPCGFLRNKNLAKFKAINDPRFPLNSMSRYDQERVYEEIAATIENLI